MKNSLTLGRIYSMLKELHNDNTKQIYTVIQSKYNHIQRSNIKIWLQTFHN